MLRKLGLKLGFLTIVVGSVIPVSAGPKPGSITGYVRNSAGAPQMGAAVEVLGSALHSFKVFTDENGFYSASGVIPGVYSVKVSAPSFLPALRERVALRAGASLVLNVTLNTLFEGNALICSGIAFSGIRQHIRYEHWVCGGEIYFLLRNHGGAGQCGLWERLADGGSAHVIYPQIGQWLPAEAGVYHATSGRAGDERPQHGAASAGA